MGIWTKRILKKLKLRGEIKTRDWLPGCVVGVETYGRPEVVSFGEGATLKIGAYCSIAPGVIIFLGGEHRTDWVTTFPFNVFWKAGCNIGGNPRSKGDVVIGNDVWIGQQALILSGVQIGDGAVVAARSTVTKSVAPYSIVGGNPAKEIRTRFDPRTIERLLQVGWWNWSREKLERFLPLLLSPDTEKFLEMAESLSKQDSDTRDAGSRDASSQAGA
jgi:acetyltransferase-like isoleucine patch superfamily enzyme